MIHVLTNCSFFYFPKDKLALKIGSIPSKKITHFSKTHWGCVCVCGGGVMAPSLQALLQVVFFSQMTAYEAF